SPPVLPSQEPGGVSPPLARPAANRYDTKGRPPRPIEVRRMLEMPLEAVVSEPKAEPADDAVPALVADRDPAETQDWLDALNGVVESEGPDRALYLLNRLQ